MDPSVSINIGYEDVFPPYQFPYIATNSRITQWTAGGLLPGAWATTQHSPRGTCHLLKLWGLTGALENRVFNASMRHLENQGCTSVYASGYSNDESLKQRGFVREHSRVLDLEGIELPGLWKKSFADKS